MIRVLHGDCRDVLRTLPDESVHCVVTSPPYWGLRDYGTAQWDGGDPECDHKESREFVNPKNTLGPNGFLPASNAANQMHQRQFRDECRKCGARRIDRQIGLEPTHQEYVAAMVDVFREVRRLLRDDGTVWLNLGDSYSGPNGNTKSGLAKLSERIDGKKRNEKNWATVRGDLQLASRPDAGLKPKDLVGIPWRVAFALQANGWYLRQDIIWSKPNPMPESVTDRCTKAHEYIFLLSKSARYYYDAEAIKESGVNRASGTNHGAEGMCSGYDGHRTRANLANGIDAKAYANKRSVWQVATQPYADAHFATFPPALIEPCILAGCPRDGTVLDPFGGAGTTGLVADRLQRNAVLIELNPQYSGMAKRRIIDDAPLFSQVAAE